MQPLQPLEEYKESRGFAVQPETQHNETLVNQTQGMIPHQEDCASPRASCGQCLCEHLCVNIHLCFPVSRWVWVTDMLILRSEEIQLN